MTKPHKEHLMQELGKAYEILIALDIKIESWMTGQKGDLAGDIGVNDYARQTMRRQIRQKANELVDLHDLQFGFLGKVIDFLE